MKKIIFAAIWSVCLAPVSHAQHDATIKEFKKVFPTYPFRIRTPFLWLKKFILIIAMMVLQINRFRKNGTWWNWRMIISK